MKQHLKQYPAILLVLSLIFFSVVGHTVASAIVILSLTALCAYRALLDSKNDPEHLKQFKNQIEDLKKRLDEREAEVRFIKEDFAKINMSLTRGFTSGQQVRF